MNNSMETDFSNLSPALIALRTCFIALLGLLIVSGNVLCIAVVRRVCNLADSTKVLMTSLAVYDLLIGIMMHFLIIASALDRWPFGEIACMVFTLLTALCFHMSVFSLLYLNIERFIAVTRPYKFPVWCSKTRVIILVLVTSFLSFSMYLIFAFTVEKFAVYAPIPCTCFLNNDHPVLTSLLLFLGDIFPTSTMTCIYSRLIQISRQHERRANANNPNGANNIQDNKALKTFLLVTLTFAACYTPVLVWQMVDSFGSTDIPPWMEFILIWLPAFNSAFNVFIYCLFNRIYRQTAKKILVERFHCWKRSVQPINI